MAVLLLVGLVMLSAMPVLLSDVINIWQTALKNTRALLEAKCVIWERQDQVYTAYSKVRETEIPEEVF